MTRDAPIELDAGPLETWNVTSALWALALCSRRPFKWTTSSNELSEALSALGAALAPVFGGVPGVAGVDRFEGPRSRAVRSRIEAAGLPATVLCEALWWPIALSGGITELELAGATHPPGGPSLHDLAGAALPLWSAFGATGELALESASFGEAAGGLVRARIFDAPRAEAWRCAQRGLLRDVRAIVLVSRVGASLALPAEARLRERLRACGIAAEIELVGMPSQQGRGLAVLVEARFEHVAGAFTVVRPGAAAGDVADEAVNELVRYLRARGALEPRQAARALVAAALAASPHGAPGVIAPGAEPGVSRFSVSEVTVGLLSIARAARALCGVDVRVVGLPGVEGMIEVRPTCA